MLTHWPEQKCLLVVPPNSGLHEPPLGVSLLKAGLQRCGVATGVYHTNTHLVEMYGLWVWQLLSMDWMLDAACSALVFPRQPREIAQFALDLAKAGILPRFRRHGRPDEVLLRLVGLIAGFREVVVDRIIASRARIVGFSSVFADRLFCVTTIREIKRRAPEIRTIVGGANCDGEMGEELFSVFPEIDYICQGYADQSLIELVQTLIKQGKVEQVPGVLSREQFSASRQAAVSLTVDGFEALPDPDFHDFFEQADQAFDRRGLRHRRGGQARLIGISPRLRRGMPWSWALNHFPSVPLETCRGCWWAKGMRDRRCAFCGDKQAMQPHLQKRPDAALAQVQRLAKEYKPTSVYLTDRLASPELANGFWDSIAADGMGLQFSTEATGSIGRDMVKVLGRAGARIIQLGIESLDASDLRSMGKPTNVIHNVATLKYFADFGMWPFWGYLGPTPKSGATDPGHAAEIIKSLTHLSPPFPPGVKPIAIYRFSRYFENPEFYGLGSLHPLPIMNAIYPLAEHSRFRLAHSFVPESAPKADMSAVRGALALWRKVHWRSHLLCIAGRNWAWLIDTRPCHTALFRRLGKDEAAVYGFCRVPRSIQAICAHLHLDEKIVADILASFVHNRTTLIEDGFYISLAVEPSKDYRWLRQEAPADFFSRYPLSEALAFAVQMNLGWRGAAWAISGVLASKAISLFLTLRWRLVCGAVQLTGVLIRKWPPTSTKKP